MDKLNVFEAEMPDDVKLACIACLYAPTGSGERIFAQNYLRVRGLGEMLNHIPDDQTRESVG